MTDRERVFARTWWGKRWLAALEDTALDAGQLRQGRRHARRGAVGAVAVRPGRVTAVVRDDDGTAQRADVLVQELDAGAWDRLLAAVAREAGHLAALLDGEMPRHLVADADAAGVELLPAIGDLEAACTCDAWDHCRHSAAVGYRMAGLLDEDPFLLLLLRGRDAGALLEEARSRAAQDAGPGADGAAERSCEAGVDAREAFALAAVLPPLPGVPPAPPASAPPAVLDLGEGLPPGPDPAALAFLAADAAARARRMLADAGAPGHAVSAPPPLPTADQDAVRLAAAGPPPHVARRLAAAGGRTGEEFERAVRAWRFGGAASLEVLESRLREGAGCGGQESAGGAAEAE